VTSEQILDGVKTRISARFETHRSALASEVSDTIATYKVLEIGDVLTPNTPAIEILPASTETELYDGQMLDDGIEEMGITLRITASGSKVSTVTKLLLRYREIIKRIVKEDPTFVSVFYRVRMGRSDWSIMTKAQEGLNFAQEMYQDITVRVPY
jgi:hypothetical protein